MRIVSFCRLLVFVGLVCLIVLEPCANLRADDTVSAATFRQLLIDGQVLDAVSAAPIQKFCVIPGVRFNATAQTPSDIAIWQPQFVREIDDGQFQWPRTSGYNEMRFRIEADGYRPATTTWLNKGGPHLRIKVHLQPDTGVSGTVLSPSGAPTANATLAIGLPNRQIQIDGCQVVGHDQPPSTRLIDRWRMPRTFTTNAQGEYELPMETDQAAMLCVVHEQGHFQSRFSELADSKTNPITIQLQPWSSIKGRVQIHDPAKARSGCQLVASVEPDERFPKIVLSQSVATLDSSGHYAFDHLPQGRVTLSLRAKVSGAMASVDLPVCDVDLVSGQAATVDFGSQGVEVVGRLAGLAKFDDVQLSMHLVNEYVRGQAAIAKLQNAPFGTRFFRDSVPVNDDGSFRIHNVPTGVYRLEVHHAAGETQFMFRQHNNEPQDIGVIQTTQLAPQEKKQRRKD